MSHLWEKEKGGKKEKKKKGRREKGNRKGGKEGRKEEGMKEKKKSSAGFKPVRLVLLVILSVQREGVVGTIGFTFLPSWATLFTVVQPAVSPSPAAPLCWAFCLCLRELVGPCGLCKLVLGRRCRCGPWQAIRQLISQSRISFVLGTCKRGLQPLWLWRRAHAAGGSSCFGFGKLTSGLERAAADPAALGLGCARARRRRIPLPWV